MGLRSYKWPDDGAAGPRPCLFEPEWKSQAGSPWSVFFSSQCGPAQCLKMYCHSSKHFKRKYHIKSNLKLEKLQDLGTLGSQSPLLTVGWWVGGGSFCTGDIHFDDCIELRLATPQKPILFPTIRTFTVGTQRGAVGRVHGLPPRPIHFSYLLAGLSLSPHC